MSQKDLNSFVPVLQVKCGQFPRDRVRHAEVKHSFGPEPVSLVVIKSYALNRDRDVVPGHGPQGHQTDPGLQRQRRGPVVRTSFREDPDAPAGLEVVVHSLVDLGLVDFGKHFELAFVLFGAQVTDEQGLVTFDTFDQQTCAQDLY